jgi:hypothetical protein
VIYIFFDNLAHRFSHNAGNGDQGTGNRGSLSPAADGAGPAGYK